MNSSATRAHLRVQLDGLGTRYRRNQSLAYRRYTPKSRARHIAAARKALTRMARIELAIIYLGMRVARAQGE